MRPGTGGKEETMYCKFCGNQIEDDAIVCPSCGEAQEQPKKKIKINIDPKKLKKVLLIAGATVAAAAIIVGAVFGIKYLLRPNDIQYHDSYSASADQLAPDTVVATMGDAKLTNSQLQVFYWVGVIDFLNENSYYLSYYGLDVSKPFDEQVYDSKTGLTWQQYFLEEAVNTWIYYQSLTLDATKNNYTPPEVYDEYFEVLPNSLEETAKKNKFDSVDALLADDFGPGVTYSDYENYLRLFYMGNLYFSDLTATIEVTDAQIEEYFVNHEEDFAKDKITKESGNLIDVRHILIKPEGGTTDADGNTTYTEAAWADCKAKAEKILQEWLDGEKTEESFAELANKNSTDTGSNTNGGLYTFVAKGDMVENFDNWCFDESRKVGDYGMVQTKFGYHIMYFSFSEAGWIRYSRSDLISELATKMLEEINNKYSSTVDYKGIALGVVDLKS